MAAAGVDMAFDLTEHSVIGFTEVLRNYFKFRRLFAQLVRFTLQVQPDAIIGIDFSGFNRRFAHAIKQYVRSRSGWFHDWDPKFVQYVSPQVWASREGRIYQMARDYDLVLSIFPFEKEWYAQRVPQLRVEFVGHPIVDRYNSAEWGPSPRSFHSPSLPTLVLLPGSRAGELNLHLPVMLGALAMIRCCHARASGCSWCCQVRNSSNRPRLLTCRLICKSGAAAACMFG